MSRLTHTNVSTTSASTLLRTPLCFIGTSFPVILSSLFITCTSSLSPRSLHASAHPQDILDRILGRFKLDVDFFETQTLTFPDQLEIPNVDDDLQRELQL